MKFLLTRIEAFVLDIHTKEYILWMHYTHLKLLLIQTVFFRKVSSKTW